MDLHADDSRISEDETERNGDDGTHDKGLKICRTVTQVVPAEGQENGQREEEEEEKEPEAEPPVPPQVSVEVALPPPAEHEVKKVTLGDTLTRRSISQQKSGVSITIDDPVRTAQVPSPPRGKISNIVHISNLVRPFTLGQLKELLGRTGTLVEEAFWIDKIKSHCFVTYSTVEEAVATRTALHGVKWPQSNPKFLCADYAEQDELDYHRGLLVDRPSETKTEEQGIPRPLHPHPHPRSSHHSTPGQSSGSRNGQCGNSGQSGNGKWSGGSGLDQSVNGIGTKFGKGPVPDQGPVTAAARNAQSLKKRRVRRKRKPRRNHLPSCWMTFSERPRQLPASIGSH